MQQSAERERGGDPDEDSRLWGGCVKACEDASHSTAENYDASRRICSSEAAHRRFVMLPLSFRPDSLWRLPPDGN